MTATSRQIASTIEREQNPGLQFRNLEAVAEGVDDGGEHGVRFES